MRGIAIGTQLPAEGLLKRLSHATVGIERGKIHIGMGKSMGAYRFVRCRGESVQPDGLALSGSGFDRVVDGAADWALEVGAPHWLRAGTHRLVGRGEVSPGDEDSFFAMARCRLEPHPESNRPPLPHLRDTLRDEIAGALQVHRRLVIDGVIRFRCPELRRALNGALNQTLDAYRDEAGAQSAGREQADHQDRNRDQEQAGPDGGGCRRPGLDQDRELLALLRDFVQMHAVKTGEVHVHARRDGPPGRYVILDTDGEVVDSEYLEGIPTNWIESEVEYQDLLMSALISLAPSHIQLHLGGNSEVVADVRRVFGTRVGVCSGCAQCDARGSDFLQGAPGGRGRVRT